MITDSSRIPIYDFLSEILAGVTDNIYSMTLPTETTKSDIEDGFIVTNVGNINDDSEFEGEAYGWVRCTVTAYISKKTRGRLNKTLYDAYDKGITAAIKAHTGRVDEGDYYILEDSVLSMDDNENTVKGNQYHAFIKSFVVVIDQQSNS